MGQRWDCRNGACGVRTGVRLTPLERVAGIQKVRKEACDRSDILYWMVCLQWVYGRRIAED